MDWFKELKCGVDLMTHSGHFEMGGWNEE
jgi:hypothetical protein